LSSLRELLERAFVELSEAEDAKTRDVDEKLVRTAPGR
jgi:hypothetical protein